MNFVGGESRGVGGHQEPPDAVIGLRPDRGHVGEVAVGDPHLGAVEHPVGTVTAGAGAHARGVGTEVGLGQAEATDRLPGRQPGQPFVLLFLGSIAVDREHRQRALHGDETAEPAVAGFQLHTRQAVADGVGAGAAVTLKVHAEHAELAELLGQLPGQRGRFEPLPDVGPQPGIDKLADRRGDFAFVGIEQPVGVEQLQRPVGGLLGSRSGGGGQRHEGTPRRDSVGEVKARQRRRVRPPLPR